MTKKDWRKVLKKFFDICFFVIFVIFLIRNFCGVEDKLELFYMIMYLINIFFKTVNYILYYKQLKRYEELFKAVEEMHKIRYEEYYLLGRKRDFEEVTTMINISASNLLIIGEELIQDKRAGKSERKEIKNIMEKTKQLTQEVKPKNA